MCALLLLSSCGTYTGSGAYAGGSFGSIIGSAIGGLAGGRHGSNVGTLIGMAGGAAVGAAIGAAADNAQQQRYEDYRSYTPRRTESSQRRYENQEDYQVQNNGDDRLYGFGEDFSPIKTAPATAANLEIRNAKLVDASRDGELQRGEEARMVFEVYNNGKTPAYAVQPSVIEITENRHIHISENAYVECILPGKGIRYTAMIKADSRLKDGEAIIRVGVSLGDKEITSQTRDFRIITRKR